MEPMIGEVRIFAGNFAPRSWALCEGQLLPISQNSALFSILGTTYGGDGRTTFALPDLRGRVAIGPGRGPGLTDRRLGERSGQETHVLTTLEMPSHNHNASVTVSVGTNTDSAGSNEGSGNTLGAGANIYNSTAPEAGEDLGGVSATGQVLNNGGSQAHNNMQPYLAVNYIIALQGVFPSRS